jgi:hypothetical protein
VTATDEKIFNGYIESFEADGGKIKIIGKDKLWDLIRKEVTHVYDKTIDVSAGKISAIFEDLITTYGGLTGGTGIQDSGTTILLEKFVCNHADIMERCSNLAKVLDWQFYYRADTDKVYFEPKGFSSNSNVLTVGDNIISVPKWTWDNTEMVNDLTVVGAFQEIETTESGRIGTTTGYTTTSILLSFTPISVKLYMDASNPPTTLKVGGLPDSTASYFYYVDKENKKLLPATATTFTATNYAEIRYSHAVPIPIHMTSPASITEYGQFKKTVTYSDLRSVTDAEVRGTNYLAKYSTPFLYSTLKVKNVSTYSLGIGQFINVIDNVNIPNINENLVITRHRIRYPADYDELVVGDKVYRQANWQGSVEERLKRLSEDEIQNQDLVVELVSFDNLVSPVNLENRYFLVNFLNMGGDTLILGNAQFGIWGSYKWGNVVGNAGFILGLAVLGTSLLGSVASSETNYFTMQNNNLYTENFIDTDFKDTSTCSWTTTGSATFTNGQTAISKSVDYNNGTITNVTLTASSSTNLVFQVTANGGTNWETVTSGVAHTFTNTGTDLRWKATASGNATLTSLSLSNYH